MRKMELAQTFNIVIMVKLFLISILLSCTPNNWICQDEASRGDCLLDYVIENEILLKGFSESTKSKINKREYYEVRLFYNESDKCMAVISLNGVHTRSIGLILYKDDIAFIDQSANSESIKKESLEKMSQIASLDIAEKESISDSMATYLLHFKIF